MMIPNSEVNVSNENGSFYCGVIEGKFSVNNNLYKIKYVSLYGNFFKYSFEMKMISKETDFCSV